MKRLMRIDSGAAVLWASAIVIAGLVILQAGRLPQNAAYADQAVSEGGYTLMTTDSGRGSDTAPKELLYIIDNRSEVLLVYEVPDARSNSLQLVGGGSLQSLFVRGSGR